MQPTTEPRGDPGPAAKIGHFAAFGVTEKLIADAIAAALSRGGDHAHVFFQHRIGSSLGLEDGAVNRAYGSARLGVGIRVVKGDQTGYGFTEDLTAEALRECARTAATIADGPGRTAPERFHVEGPLPQRYPVRLRWEEVRPQQKLPLLAALNEAFAADPRVRKVNVHFAEESSAILLADSRGSRSQSDGRSWKRFVQRGVYSIFSFLLCHSQSCVVYPTPKCLLPGSVARPIKTARKKGAHSGRPWRPVGPPPCRRLRACAGHYTREHTGSRRRN